MNRIGQGRAGKRAMPNAITVSPSAIAPKVHWIRHEKVILDFDLAALYGVETGALNRAVKRNIERFPQDFMFQINREEAAALRCQTGILNAPPLDSSQPVMGSSFTSQTVALKPGRGRHRKYLPYAFTEQGVAMLSSVLRSNQNDIVPRLPGRFSRRESKNREAVHDLTNLSN